MKKLVLAGIVLTSLTLTANAQYIDLTTGKKITIVKNNANGIVSNPETQHQVFLYVDPTTGDTLYGRTGEVVNGKVSRTKNGYYVYKGDPAYTYSNGEYRPHREDDDYEKIFQRDGDVKLKGPNFKKKTEIDGDVKVKDNGAKVKLENDGVQKVKAGDYRRKIDSKGNFREGDSTFKVKDKVDGSYKIKDKNKNFKGKIDENGNIKEKGPNFKRKSKNGNTSTKASDSTRSK